MGRYGTVRKWYVISGQCNCQLGPPRASLGVVVYSSHEARYTALTQTDSVRDTTALYITSATTPEMSARPAAASELEPATKPAAPLSEDDPEPFEPLEDDEDDEDEDVEFSGRECALVFVPCVWNTI